MTSAVNSGATKIRLSIRSSTPPWPGNRAAHVLRAQLAFEQADREIAERRAETDDQADAEEFVRRQRRESETEQPGQQHRDRQGAERAFPGFPRADLTPQRMTAEHFPEAKSRNIRELSGEKDEAKITGRICQIREQTRDVRTSSRDKGRRVSLTKSARALRGRDCAGSAEGESASRPGAPWAGKVCGARSAQSPKAAMPALTITLIARSSCARRANSRVAQSASAPTPRMKTTRPPRIATAASGAMNSQEK